MGFVVGADGLEGGGGGVLLVGVLSFFPIALKTEEAIFDPPNTFELIPKALDVMFLKLGASEVSLDFEGSETPEGFGGSDKLGDGGRFPKGFDGINFVASECSIGFEGS